MPRGRQKPTHLKKTFPYLITLLVKFLLIKLGNIPYSIYHIPRTRSRGRPKKFHLPTKTKLVILGIFLLLFFLFYTYFTIQAARSLPSPTRLVSSNKPLTSEFFDRNGKLLYRLYEGRNRTLVNLDQLPKYLIWATVAAEDKNFYHHPGFDPEAIFRAVVTNLQTGQLQGASTITQQLIKNSLLTPEKTLSRKLKEIFLAFWAERLFSKDEILQMYLNEAPYGGPAWGIEAGAESYFGKGAKELTLAEATFLAGLPASPTQFSPYGSQPDLAKERQKQVLNRMVEDGYINRQQAKQALDEPLALLPRSNQIKAPHFVMYVRELLSQKYGPRVVSQGGLKVYTSLDLGLQEEVERVVKEEVEKLSGLNVQNGAAMIIEAKTGQILTMVGSKDYHDPKFGNFNVTLALRQPGSSIKVATYAEAFKKGFSPGNTILDTPVSFPNSPNPPYTPQNYDGAFHGPVSIRVALGSSYNVPAVKMLATVTLPDMIQTAKDLGITTFEDAKRYGLSLTLGGGDVKMIDMMAVYGTLSQMGRQRRPTPILKVTDSNGNILEEYDDSPQQVLQPEIAYLITDILSDNKARTAAFGPSSLLLIPGHQVAVKTGTSDSKRDNWTFGYTPQVVVGVWVGNNDNSPMNQALTSGITGAAPIWHRIMTGMLKNREPLTFTRPAGVIDVTLDGRKDLAVAGVLSRNLVRVSQDKDKTTFFDAFSSYATSSAITSLKNGSTN